MPLLNIMPIKNSVSIVAVLLAALLLFEPAAPAQRRQSSPQSQPASSKKFEMTIDSIMRGPDVVGYEPSRVVWSQDSRRVYFRWKRAGEPRLREPDTYVVGRDGAGLRKLTEDEARQQAPPAAGELSKDRTLSVFTEDGDVFLYDHAKSERRALTRTSDIESNAHFTGDQRRVSFTRQNNLYALPLDGGPLEQLTDIRVGGGGGAQPGATPPPRAGSESQETLRKEERALLEAVRERAEQREEQEAKRRKREKRRPSTPRGQSLASLTLSAHGAYVSPTWASRLRAAKAAIVPNYVTETAYTEDINSRSKVGDAQGRTRMAVVSVETGEVKWVEHGQKVEVAPTIRTRTETNATEQAQREQGVGAGQTQAAQQAQQQTGQQAQTQSQTQGQQAPPTQQQGQQTEATTAQQARDRDVQLFQLQWSEDGARAALIARAADNKDRWVMSLDPSTGRTRVLARVHDDAWVGGPGSFTLGWLPDNRRVYFISERDGFAPLCRPRRRATRTLPPENSRSRTCALARQTSLFTSARAASSSATSPRCPSEAARARDSLRSPATIRRMSRPTRRRSPSSTLTVTARPSFSSSRAARRPPPVPGREFQRASRPRRLTSGLPTTGLTRPSSRSRRATARTLTPPLSPDFRRAAGGLLRPRRGLSPNVHRGVELRPQHFHHLLWTRLASRHRLRGAAVTGATGGRGFTGTWAARI